MSKWVLYLCSDCDADDGAVILLKPDDTSEEAGCSIDFCPGCDSRYSLLNMGDV